MAFGQEDLLSSISAFQSMRSSVSGEKDASVYLTPDLSLELPIEEPVEAILRLNTDEKASYLIEMESLKRGLDNEKIHTEFLKAQLNSTIELLRTIRYSLDEANELKNNLDKEIQDICDDIDQIHLNLKASDSGTEASWNESWEQEISVQENTEPLCRPTSRGRDFEPNLLTFSEFENQRAGLSVLQDLEQDDKELTREELEKRMLDRFKRILWLDSIDEIPGDIVSSLDGFSNHKTWAIEDGTLPRRYKERLDYLVKIKENEASYSDPGLVDQVMIFLDCQSVNF